MCWKWTRTFRIRHTGGVPRFNVGSINFFFVITHQALIYEAYRGIPIKLKKGRKKNNLRHEHVMSKTSQLVIIQKAISSRSCKIHFNKRARHNSTTANGCIYLFEWSRYTSVQYKDLYRKTVSCRLGKFKIKVILIWMLVSQTTFLSKRRGRGHTSHQRAANNQRLTRRFPKV